MVNKPKKFAPVVSAAQAVHILKAKRYHCRAVLDERASDGLAMFCGARKLAGSSFCAEHTRLFFTRPYPMRPSAARR